MTQEDKINHLRGFYPQLNDDLIINIDISEFLTEDLRYLPDNLTVNSSLNLSDCKNLISIGNNLICYSLDLEDNTSIKTIGDNLFVKGYLDLDGCESLTSIGDNLFVGGSLYIDNTKITSNENYIISDYIGSRESKTFFFKKQNIIKCGCFSGSLERFKERVSNTYNKENEYWKEYDEFINLCLNNL